ncbi:17425_t:CDS:1, partial [Dentiscutata heterogama]
DLQCKNNQERPIKHSIKNVESYHRTPQNTIEHAPKGYRKPYQNT